MALTAYQAGPIGDQVAEALAAHEARSAVRRLAAGLFDAWDSGDVEAFVRCFALDARWQDATGADEISALYLELRAEEPWSLHWLSNETILIDGEEAEGRWLWFSASRIDGGRVSAWLGGDMVIRAAKTDGGWRIRVLSSRDRYRTPVRQGWLRTLRATPGDVTAAGDDGPCPVTPPVGTVLPPPPPSGQESLRLDRLRSETAVRALMAEYVDGAERGVSGAAQAACWTANGAYRVEGREPVEEWRGRNAIAHRLDEERTDIQVWLRFLSSEWIVVSGDNAVCRWRDLWVAERDDAAAWFGHQYLLRACRASGQWRFERLVRRRLLDVRYGEAWW